jgi:hypothetical protein
MIVRTDQRQAPGIPGNPEKNPFGAMKEADSRSISGPAHRNTAQLPVAYLLHG